MLISTLAETLHQRRAPNPHGGERCILGVRMEAVSCDAGVKKGGELSVRDSRTEGIAPCEILQCRLPDFV